MTRKAFLGLGLIAGCAGQVHATAVSPTAIQINAVPAGFYQPQQAGVADDGSGRFMVFWTEDTTNDVPNNTGFRLRSRGLQTVGAGFGPYKPSGLVSTVNPVGRLLLLGTHRTVNNDSHVVWSQTASGLTSLYKQQFRAGNKLGGIVPLATNINGGSARLVTGRTDKVSALVWRVNAGTPNHVGRLLSPSTGTLGSSLGFNLDLGELLLRTEGVGNTFVATTSSFDPTFTKWRIRGRSFSSAFAMAPVPVLLQNFLDLAKAPWSQVATRTDGRVIYFSSLVNGTQKIDMRASPRTASWGVVSPAVLVGPNLPADTSSGPVWTRLPNGGLLTAQRMMDGAGYSIFIKTYNAALAQVGATAKIGPVPEISVSGIERLSTGKAIVVYTQGKAIMARQVTP
jgi:hypothetical protein